VKETRRLALPPSLRAADGKPRLCGYAAKFGSEYMPYGRDGGFVETIAKGAFSRTLRESPDVRALANHNTDCVLGRTTSGTLSLREDDDGLAFEIDPPDTSYGRDTAVSVERGDLSGCSFGFMVRDYQMTQRGDGMTVCTLLDVDLHEISICAFPAYEDTQVSLRSIDRYRLKSHPSLEWAARRLQLSL
jgi:uncharacterized protein